MTLIRNRRIGLAIAAVIFVVDQLVKWLIDARLHYEGDTIHLLPFFDLQRVHNEGVSLGLLSATSPEMRWGLVAMTALIALGVTVWMFREKLLGDIVGLALVLGGALGNIIDRTRFGYVLDYADLHFGEFRPFMVFNLADAAITIGVLIILARSFLSREKRDDQAANPASES